MTTREIYESFMGTLEAVQFKHYKTDTETIMPEVTATEPREGAFHIKIEGPGGRFKFGIGKYGLMMSESPQSNTYWIQQVEAVYKKFSKVKPG